MINRYVLIAGIIALSSPGLSSAALYIHQDSALSARGEGAGGVSFPGVEIPNGREDASHTSPTRQRATSTSSGVGENEPSSLQEVIASARSAEGSGEGAASPARQPSQERSGGKEPEESIQHDGESGNESSENFANKVGGNVNSDSGGHDFADSSPIAGPHNIQPPKGQKRALMEEGLLSNAMTKHLEGDMGWELEWSSGSDRQITVPYTIEFKDPVDFVEKVATLYGIFVDVYPSNKTVNVRD